MSDDADSGPKEKNDEDQPRDSGEKVFVDPIQPKIQEDPLGKKDNNATPHVEPSGSSASLWQLFKCRFKLWHEKRRVSKRSPEKSKLTDIGTLILTAVVAGAAIYSAWVFHEQLKAMQNQFELTDRPWIKVEPQVASPITFTGEGSLNVSATFVLDNVGHSVATDVTVQANVFAPKRGKEELTEPLERQKKLCEKVEPNPLTITLFPGDVKQPSGSWQISRQDIEANIMPSQPGEILHPPGRRILPVFLYGCVDYRFSTLPKHHQTGFIYSIVRTDPKYPSVPFVIIVDQTLPVSNIGLQRWIFGGDYAN
jgi:hypothetical protein